MKKIVVMLLLFSISLFAQQTYYDAIPVLDSVSTANGDTLSSSADLKGNLLFTIEVPSSFDGTEITIYTSRNSSNFKPVYNSDNEILKVTVTAGRKYYLTPANYYWVDRYIKIESNSAASGADKFYITKGKYFKT